MLPAFFFKVDLLKAQNKLSVSYKNIYNEHIIENTAIPRIWEPNYYIVSLITEFVHVRA